MEQIILTPVTLWSDFDSSLPIDESVIKEFAFDGIRYSYIYFSGRKTSSSKRVRIYGVFARPDDEEKHAGLLILPDIDTVLDIDLLTRYARQGYCVLEVDYAGESQINENFTKYPEEIAYANYCKAGRAMNYAEPSAKETSWYEWNAVAKYAISFLSASSNCNRKIGVMGIRQGGNLAWILAGSDDRLSCFISLFGAGWQAYKGTTKYSEDNYNIELNDERHRYLAGIDMHAYAQYVKCPVLFLATTNDRYFDCDRSYDTLSRLKNVKYYFNYSARYDGYLGKNSSTNIDTFLSRYLGQEDLFLPKEPDITLMAKEGELSVKLNVDNTVTPESVKLYVSEGCIDPSIRNWAEIKNPTSNNSNGTLIYNFAPFKNSVNFFAYAKVKYDNGFTLSSRIIYKKLDSSVTVRSGKSNILYNSISGLDMFTGKKPKDKLIGNVLYPYPADISMQEGPNGIKGIYSPYGLKLYNVNDLKFKAPSENSILMFDVYSAEYVTLTFTVLVGCLTNKPERYEATVMVRGGEYWSNKRLNSLDFKLKDKMLTLKDFCNIDVLIVDGTGKYALNNILWI